MILLKMKVVCRNEDCPFLKKEKKPFSMYSNNQDEMNDWMELISKKALKCSFCQQPMDFEEILATGGNKKMEVSSIPTEEI